MRYNEFENLALWFTSKRSEYKERARTAISTGIMTSTKIVQEGTLY